MLKLHKHNETKTLNDRVKRQSQNGLDRVTPR